VSGSWKDRGPAAVLRGVPHVYKTLAVAVLAATCLLPGEAAGAPPPRSCSSADLRYPFEPGGPRAFGVFRLRIADGTCATAHRVARRWMNRFEARLRAGRVVLPRSLAGFKFTRLPVHVAQTYRVRGRRGATTIWFDYRVPNG
jgi:hypothetical protein